MYKHIKSTLQKSGEVMVRVSDGQTFELHLHNTVFDDAESIIEVDTGVEKYWINGNDISYMWIHRAAKES